MSIETETCSKLFLEVIPPLMQVLREEMRKVATENLTVPQFRVLNQLKKRPLSNHELANWMGVSAPTMSRMIDGLARKKLLIRKVENKNRRQISVQLTPLGEKYISKVRVRAHRKIDGMLEKLSGPQRKAILLGLSAMGEVFL